MRYMANLQHEFTYEGNNFSEVPFTQISWNLEIPTFEYVNDQRNLLGSHSLKFFQALKSESYAVNFLNEFLIGQSDDSILNFWRFSKNFQKNLGSLSFRANRSVMHDTQVLRQDSVEIIYSLATSSIEYDQIIAAEIALNQGVFLNPVEARKVASAIIKYAKENLLLINKAIFDKVVVRFKELAHTTQEFPLLRIISHLADISTKKPILVNINATVLADLITREGLGLEGNIQDIIKLISDNFDTLFNFPISVPEIKILEIKGDIKFLSQRGEMATKTDLFNYDLSLEYTEQVTNQPRTVKYRWESFSDTPIPDNLEEFDFRKNNEFVLIANPTTSVTVTLRLLDNTILEQKTFDGLDKEDLAHIHFEVDLFKLPQPNNTDTKKTDDNKQLKGKVLEISGKCPLQDLTVIIQAKEKATDPLWKVVASATTSNAGDFVMKYPFGEFEKAQAIVSLTPDSPVDIFIFTDEDHKKAKETISTDFLFLLLKDAKCEPKVETATGDCGCDTKERISRLPNHEDLINSDKFYCKLEFSIRCMIYYLDVATNSDFASILLGYNNLAVAGNSQSITNLTAGRTYYYRVRSANGTGSSPSSTIWRAS